MSMLAGPRQKQKVINLRAKNNAWSNDSNKFGQKMLEKMGWSAGKGLGANENGMVEHVIARYKNDDRGLGFEDKNDQWTKHEDDFNALLANLSNGEAKEEILHSGVSLEDKSKKSKARVHYHKFTRGKDLSKYSEKDLANIFGKKTFKPTKAEPEVEKDDVKTTEQVFTEKGSMADYFQTKLAAFKSKNKDISFEYKNKENDSAEYTFKGFAGTKDYDSDNNHTSMGFGYQASFVQSSVNQSNCTEELYTEDAEVEPEIKKKKKKSKRKHDVESQSADSINSYNQLQTDESNEIQNEEVVDEPDKPPKKKKHKKKYENSEIHECTEQIIEENLSPKKKKKKNKKMES